MGPVRRMSAGAGGRPTDTARMPSGRRPSTVARTVAGAIAGAPYVRRPRGGSGAPWMTVAAILGAVILSRRRT